MFDEGFSLSGKRTAKTSQFCRRLSAQGTILRRLLPGRNERGARTAALGLLGGFSG